MTNLAGEECILFTSDSELEARAYLRDETVPAKWDEKKKSSVEWHHRALVQVPIDRAAHRVQAQLDRIDVFGVSSLDARPTAEEWGVVAVESDESDELHDGAELARELAEVPNQAGRARIGEVLRRTARTKPWAPPRAVAH